MLLHRTTHTQNPTLDVPKKTDAFHCVWKQKLDINLSLPFGSPAVVGAGGGCSGLGSRNSFGADCSSCL